MTSAPPADRDRAAIQHMETGGAMSPRPVLLVHSAVDVRRIYRAALEHAGYRVLDTWDADDALMLLAKHDCSAVVTDLYVESVSGEPCLLRRLRRRTTGASLPVIVVTAWTSQSYRDIARREGATEFLPMPTLPRELVARVSRYAQPGLSPPEMAAS